MNATRPEQFGVTMKVAKTPGAPEGSLEWTSVGAPEVPRRKSALGAAHALDVFAFEARGPERRAPLATAEERG